jgi:hypothetical protein
MRKSSALAGSEAQSETSPGKVLIDEGNRKRNIKGAPRGVWFECFSSTVPEEERPL